jgi:integrase
MGSQRSRGAALTAPGATAGGNPDVPKPYTQTRSAALMARPNTGEVTERLWKDSKTITFGARLYAYGRRHRLVFGTNTQGWNETRADIELESILQQVERGTWVPPEKKTSVKPTREERPDGHQPFGPFARKVVERKEGHGLAEGTTEDNAWRLGYLIDYFGRFELLDIDVAMVDDFRDEMVKRAQVIRDAAKRSKPVMETVKGRGGKTYQRAKKPLANSSINKLLELLSQIMQVAVDYEHVRRDPVKVGQHSQRFLPTPKKSRTFLEVDELKSLLDAAGELDRAKQLAHRIGRCGALATLSLTGFRISELCDMRCSQVDLARSRFKLTDAKTAKGVREVEMTLWNHDELVAHRQQRLRDGFPMGPADHFFGTHTGKRRDSNRFRDRVLSRSVKHANETRAKEGLAPLPKITPHGLRRTWAMLAAQAGRDPHWISDQIGHTSAAFTLQVYQQTRNRRLTEKERQAIWELMRFADEPTECPFTRQSTRTIDGPNGPMNRPMEDSDPRIESESPGNER